MTDEQITLNASQYCDIMNDKNEAIRLIRFASYVVGATTTKAIIEKEKCELLGTIQDKDKVLKELRENYDERGRTIISLERQLRLNIHNN